MTTSRRGTLRVYLGAAPGAGKTFAMLDEGHRRIARGTDVVVAFVETHGRAHTADKLQGLEVIPRRIIDHRGASFTEMDLQAVLQRNPQVALVDEMAHTNVPGAEHEKRWQDVERLLEAGIDVISTVNVQHLESLNDVVEAITGVPQRETVPDAVVRAAEQVELVDITPEALRRRMAHGNIYASDKVDAALSNYFRPGNLTALRELALLWLADSVDEGLQRYREAHGIASTWETRERVVVALTGGPEGEALLRRAARIAARATGGELLAVHIARSDGLAGSSIAALDQQRLLVESLGGSYHSVIGDNVPAALLDFARANHATQIVIGASRRKPLAAALTGPGTGATITRTSGSIDVHVVSHDYVGKGRVLPRLTSGITMRRRLAGLITAAVLFAALVPIGAAFRSDLSLASDILLFLLVVVICALIGGFLPAVASAVVGSVLLNYYFAPPVHTFTISHFDNVLALIVFIVIAILVSRVVDLAARRNVESARSNAEAETLSTLAGSLLRGEQALPALLDRVRETFAVSSVTLLRREIGAPASSSATRTGATTGGIRGSWTCVDSIGVDPCMRPEDGDTEVTVGEDLRLVLRGRTLGAEDQRVLAAFATQAAVAYQQRQLTDAAAAAKPLAETDRIRTALLNAVSHDLHTPIASAKAAVSSLLSRDVDWSAADRHDLLVDADAALDRLNSLVGNLLDLSRLQAGALTIQATPVGVDDVVSRVLEHTDHSDQVEVDVPATLPEVLADPGLLERAIANLLENAMRYTDPARPVRLSASAHGDIVELRVIDFGPGIPLKERDAVFEPFQRRDDHTSSTGAGVGLGLAIARGFIEAMSGVIELEDTPGGGLTSVISLMCARTKDVAATGDPAVTASPEPVQ
ncbi:MAG: osmosensitive channel signal transduction histidine kinase [Pseudonocardiales bacterium]|nr:osmosensitive channel signal transduction histidine kinase [Pseudonocardiales bacterium]